MKRGREIEKAIGTYISETGPLSKCTGGHGAHVNWVMYTCTSAFLSSFLLVYKDYDMQCCIMVQNYCLNS